MKLKKLLIYVGWNKLLWWIIANIVQSTVVWCIASRFDSLKIYDFPGYHRWTRVCVCWHTVFMLVFISTSWDFHWLHMPPILGITFCTHNGSIPNPRAKVTCQGLVSAPTRPSLLNLHEARGHWDPDGRRSCVPLMVGGCKDTRALALCGHDTPQIGLLEKCRYHVCHGKSSYRSLGWTDGVIPGSAVCY